MLNVKKIIFEFNSINTLKRVKTIMVVHHSFYNLYLYHAYRHNSERITRRFTFSKKKTLITFIEHTRECTRSRESIK